MGQILTMATNHRPFNLIYQTQLLLSRKNMYIVLNTSITFLFFYTTHLKNSTISFISTAQSPTAAIQITIQGRIFLYVPNTLFFLEHPSSIILHAVLHRLILLHIDSLLVLPLLSRHTHTRRRLVSCAQLHRASFLLCTQLCPKYWRFKGLVYF